MKDTNPAIEEMFCNMMMARSGVERLKMGLMPRLFNHFYIPKHGCGTIACRLGRPCYQLTDPTQL